MKVLIFLMLFVSQVALAQELRSMTHRMNSDEILTNQSLSSGAELADESGRVSGRTKLQVLSDYYEQGQPITFEDIKGFYSGRCYLTNAPDTASNVFLGYGAKDSYNNGPGFPESDQWKMLTMEKAGAPASYFDYAPGSEEGRNYFSSLLNAEWAKIDMLRSRTVAFTYDWEGNGNADEKHEFVRYRDFFVEKWTAMIRQDYGDLGTKNPGDHLGMCYYFKKLAN